MPAATPPRNGRKASSANGGVRTAASARQSPRQNHLLDALPGGDYERLASHLEPISMRLGDVLYEPGVKLKHVYFPTTSIVSLLYVLENGASAEIAIVGNEGILGISLFMGGTPRPAGRWCKAPGMATGSGPGC